MKKLLFFFLPISVVLFPGCREDDETVAAPTTINLKGHVQKGPFINGTAIMLSELNPKLTATGKTFTTQIADNQGSFTLVDIPLQSHYVQLQADGFYFDEVRGEKSTAQLTLFALADVAGASIVNINLLSHLERSRVIYLMQEKDQPFTVAKKQAQQEILAAFGIEQGDMRYAEQLDISQDGEQNAILLAISAVLQGNNAVAELSELLANITTDLREDGVLTSETLQTRIKAQAVSLNLPQIRKNLEARYEEMGVSATIPDFEQYIDSDGDGFLNKDEDDTPDDFAFEAQVDVAINDTIISNAITISGLKEGGIAYASVNNGWLVVNGSVVPASVSGVNQRDTLSIAEVKNGDQLQIRLASSRQFADTTIASLTVGTSVQAFYVVTDDYSPDAFSFKKVANARPETTYASDTITITGLPHPLPKEYVQFDPDPQATSFAIFVNGEKQAFNSFGVKEGDRVWMEVVSSERFRTSLTSKLVVNNHSAEFKLTTSPNPLQVKAEFPGVIGDASTCFSIGEYIYAKASSNDAFDDPLKTSQFFRYDTTTDEWTRVADFPGSSRRGEVGFAINGKGYLGLGYKGQGRFLNDLWVYDPEQDSWSQTTDFPGEGRFDAAIFTIKSDAYVGLGVHFPVDVEERLKDFWKFNTLTNTWVRVSDFRGKERDGSFYFSVNDKGYIGGGWVGKVGNDFWEYDPTTDQWTQRASLPKAEEMGIGFSVANKGYVIFAGFDYTYEYDVDTDTWSAIKTGYFGNYPSTGTSTLEKGYVIDHNKIFYEFTPPQD